MNRKAIVRVAGIKIDVAPYEWSFARDEAARIDAHWTARRQARPELFDGRVLLMHELTLADGYLCGACYEASYKSFLSWRELGFPGTPVANVFGMSALRSADGAFMLGEMSPTTAAGGRLYFPAGTPEPSDLGADGRIDFEANILRELEEETGIGPGDIALDEGWTIVFDGPTIACMRLAQSALVAGELQSRLAAFNETEAHPELVSLVPVSSPADYDGSRMPGFMLQYLDWALSPSDQAR